MSRRDIIAGKASVLLGVDSTALQQGLKQAQADLNAFGAQLIGIGTTAMTVGGSITGAIVGAAASFASTGGNLDDMAARTNTSVEALSELAHVANAGGSNIDTMGNALFRMQRRIANATTGSGPAQRALRELGLSAEELSKQTPDKQLEILSDALIAVGDDSLAAQYGFEILGDQFKALSPALKGGSAEIKRLRKEARDLGLQMTSEDAAAAGSLGDAFDRLTATMGAVVNQIGAAVAPTIDQIVNGMAQAVAAVVKLVRENRPLVVTIAKVGATILATGAAIVGFGTAFTAAGAAIAGVVAAIKTAIAAVVMAKSVVGAITAALALLTSPIGLVALAVTGAAAAWLYFTDSGQKATFAVMGTIGGFVGRIRSYFGELSTTVTTAFAGIRDAIAGGDFALAGRIAMTALRMVFLHGLEAIKSMFGETIGNIIGTFGEQIAGGDFSGAWQTVLGSMNLAFETFSNGIVTMFTGAAKAVIEVWRSTVDAITNYILQQAAKGGVIGYGFEKLTGVNVKDEVAQAERNKQAEAAITARRQARVDDITAKIDIETDPAKLEELQEQLADARVALDSMGGLQLPDIFDQVASGAYQSEANKAIADRLNNSLDKMQADSDEAAKGARDALASETAGGADGVSEEYIRLRDELVAMQKRVAESRDAMRSSGAMQGLTDGGGSGSLGDRGPKSIGTFSAAAALAAGRGAAEDKTQRLIKDQTKVAEKQLVKLDQAVAAIKDVGGWMVFG